jgi:TRAP-type C4-dicarboxylate transport system substrate-binding protein
MRTGILGYVAGAIILAGWSGGAAAQTKLLASIFFPPSHPIYSKVMVPWAQDVEKASNGELKVEFAASSLAPPPGQLDLVSKGIADIAIQFSGVVPNRLSLTLIGEQFGPVSTAHAMSTALWRTHVRFFEPANEYKGLKLIALVAFAPQRFYTVKEPIVSLEQLKRSKVAVTPGTLAKAYGSVTTGVVAVPAVRFFDLVSKGMVDAFVVTPIEIYSFNLRDFTRYAMKFRDTGTVTATFAVVMNEAKWKSLSPSQQAAIERHSGEAFATRMSAIDEAAEAATEQARRDGVRFVDAPSDFNEEVRKAFLFTIDEWVASARSRGVDGKAALEFYHAEHQRLAGGR